MLKLYSKWALLKSTLDPMMHQCRLNMQKDHFQMLVMDYRHTCSPSVSILVEASPKQPQSFTILKMETLTRLQTDLH